MCPVICFVRLQSGQVWGLLKGVYFFYEYVQWLQGHSKLKLEKAVCNNVKIIFFYFRSQMYECIQYLLVGSNDYQLSSFT